jgi:hypothetical protein
MGATSDWGRGISEVIAYERELSAAEKESVYSYLDMKYAITLDYDKTNANLNFNYFLSDGALIWEGATNPLIAKYHNNVAALVRDEIIPASVDDRNLSVIQPLCKQLFGKLYGDKGYISASLCELLFDDGLLLVTGMKSNMKNRLMTLRDKILLRKRSVIEIINDELKNICEIEHSRHRSADINNYVFHHCFT